MQKFTLQTCPLKCFKSLVICDLRFESQIAIAVKSRDFQRKFLRVRRGCQASQRKGLTPRGSLGNFRGTPGLLLSPTVRGVPGSRRKTSGEVPNPRVANPRVAERAPPWRSTKRGVAEVCSLLEMPTDSCHFPCTSDTLVRPQNSLAHGRLFQLPEG